MKEPAKRWGERAEPQWSEEEKKKEQDWEKSVGCAEPQHGRKTAAVTLTRSIPSVHLSIPRLLTLKVEHMTVIFRECLFRG